MATEKKKKERKIPLCDKFFKISMRERLCTHETPNTTLSVKHQYIISQYFMDCPYLYIINPIIQEYMCLLESDFNCNHNKCVKDIC